MKLLKTGRFIISHLCRSFWDTCPKTSSAPARTIEPGTWKKERTPMHRNAAHSTDYSPELITDYRLFTRSQKQRTTTTAFLTCLTWREHAAHYFHRVFPI